MKQMNKVTLLDIALVKEIPNRMSEYKIHYMDTEVNLVVVKSESGTTYNWDKELPELVYDFIEAWLEEEI